MQLKILADESVNFGIVKQLREKKYSVHSILEEKPGVSDLNVLEYAKELGSVLLTEDKDFGEWVFAYHYTNVSVVLLRYNSGELNEITESLFSVLQNLGDSILGKFVVIRKKKYRIREL